MRYLKTYESSTKDVINKGLTSLPELSDDLLFLYCNYNKLTSLPELPESLQILFCHHNKLTSLPELPDTLRTLNCGDNPFEYPLSQDIMTRFKLDVMNLYTIDRIVHFQSYEWQKDFLERTGQIHDIKRWILPEIKKEFHYLYDSDELGLL